MVYEILLQLVRRVALITVLQLKALALAMAHEPIGNISSTGDSGCPRPML